MAHKIDYEKVKMGRLIRVVNQDPHHSANKLYTSVWLEDASGKEENCYLFTEQELKRALNRAKKNKEDLPKRDWLTDLLD